MVCIDCVFDVGVGILPPDLKMCVCVRACVRVSCVCADTKQLQYEFEIVYILIQLFIL